MRLLVCPKRWRLLVNALILAAAHEHLTEETLLRTPHGSYEKAIWEEQKRQSTSSFSILSVVEWQSDHKAATQTNHTSEDQSSPSAAIA
jgi:hypothetical protein